MASQDPTTDHFDRADFNHGGHEATPLPSTKTIRRRGDTAIDDDTESASFRKIGSNEHRHRIGRYDVVQRLGQGGTAEVFHARHVESGQDVALKVFKTQQQDYESLFREASASINIRHQNVITCYGIGEDRGRFYMTMELVSGGDLIDLVSRRGGLLPVPEALRLAIGCCAGLGAVEEAGFVHRDIKPGNIFLSEEGVPKLADLGLASHTQHEEDGVQLQHMGTPAYMSPEQATGDELDIRSDIYSLGATIYFMVTGHPPFSGTDPVQVVTAVLNQDPPDPRGAVPNLNDDLVAVILRTLRKTPGERYVSPAALAEDLQALLDGRRPVHHEIIRETETMLPAVSATDRKRTVTDTGSGWQLRQRVAALNGVSNI